MVKKSYFNFTVISLLIFILVGCDNTENRQTEVIPDAYSSVMSEEDIPTSESIQDLTEVAINKKYPEAEKINFEDYECIDEVSYLAFSFINNKESVFGFTVAEQDGDKLKLSYFENYPNDKEQSIMITQFIGSYPGTEDRVFHVTAGYVNDKQVEEMVLYYPGSNIKIIKLGDDQHGFIDIDINSDDSLLKIEAKSSKDKIVYQKEF